MIDYFAVLELPRLPHLEERKLEESFHRLARRCHSDLNSDQCSKLAVVNEAFATLQKPAARLKHLLALEGRVADSTGQLNDSGELFAQAATVAEGTRQLLRSKPGASAISHSVAGARRSGAIDNLRRLLAELDEKYGYNLQMLQSVNQLWDRDREGALHEVTLLQKRFTFLERWRQTLGELLFQLEH